MKKKLLLSLFGVMCLGLSGCSNANASGTNEIVIYTNADEEILDFMRVALDSNGYDGQYILQGMGTSELGGKLMAEGTNIEADLISMSGYYIDSAQQQHDMFLDLDAYKTPLLNTSAYQIPLTGLQSTILINTEMISSLGLDTPTSMKDLADPQYAGLVSVPDITGSSTAWLLIQTLLNEYSYDEALSIMEGIISNAELHLESSGSGPIKKIRAGEVAVGMGLRHQAVADELSGLPVGYVDPIEGNYQLTESLAVVKKGNSETEELAKEMLYCIIENTRDDILDIYQTLLYEGETLNGITSALYPREYKDTLTVDLLAEHTAFSELAKSNIK
ncbi:MAG: ABC transporter substrate-binding protein [Epulopiscium sp. Nele67-Bin004]|nr:MAG: ABC transporter substrate-binding protein [Epulopiscium sp. Nele67-Bin004]